LLVPQWFKKDSLVSLGVNSFIMEDRVNDSPFGHCNPNTNFNLMRCHRNNFMEIVQSRAINFGRQGHSLTQSKMLHCKTVVNVIT
jgi:hypothetical protein